MTVQDLIDELNKVKDKSKEVTYVNYHRWSGVREFKISSVYEDYCETEIAIQSE